MSIISIRYLMGDGPTILVVYMPPIIQRLVCEGWSNSRPGAARNAPGAIAITPPSCGGRPPAQDIAQPMRLQGAGRKHRIRRHAIGHALVGCQCSGWLFSNHIQPISLRDVIYLGLCVATQIHEELCGLPNTPPRPDGIPGNGSVRDGQLAAKVGCACILTKAMSLPLLLLPPCSR